MIPTSKDPSGKNVLYIIHPALFYCGRVVLFKASKRFMCCNFRKYYALIHNKALYSYMSSQL